MLGDPRPEPHGRLQLEVISLSVPRALKHCQGLTAVQRVYLLAAHTKRLPFQVDPGRWLVQGM